MTADVRSHPQSLRALLIGGFDPTGGAGLLLDAFVAARLGMQPAAVVATVTAQDSTRWLTSAPVDAALLTAQLDALAAEGPFACVKIGAIGSAANVTAVAQFLYRLRPPAVVLDPVLVSSSGGALATAETTLAMRTELFALAEVITPNADEARALSPAAADCTKAAAALAAAHGCRVLVTGLPDARDARADLLVAPNGTASRHAHPYIAEVGDIRGTGCMLSTALACRLAEEASLEAAVVGAHSDLLGLLHHARQVGRGRMQVDFADLVGSADSWARSLHVGVAKGPREMSDSGDHHLALRDAPRAHLSDPMHEL